MSELDQRFEDASKKLRELDKNFVEDLTNLITHQEGPNSRRYILGTDCKGAYIQDSENPEIKGSISNSFYNLLQKCPVIGLSE